MRKLSYVLHLKIKNIINTLTGDSFADLISRARNRIQTQDIETRLKPKITPQKTPPNADKINNILVLLLLFYLFERNGKLRYRK